MIRGSWACFWSVVGWLLLVPLRLASTPDLYALLKVPRNALTREIRKAYHVIALRTHPDKVEGKAQKEAAEQKFKAVTEAYEMLSDADLRRTYDRTGVISGHKAASHSKASSDEEGFGFESNAPPPRQSWGGGFWRESYDSFALRLAQQRARQLHSLQQLRDLLQDANGVPTRIGLIGFYRKGEDSFLKHRVRFPYPFAGWSLGSTGDGFWWEDEIQSALVSIGPSTDTGELSNHFGLTHTSSLPVVAWVGRSEELSFELASPQSADEFMSWVWSKLTTRVRIVNRDHRPAKVWWLDGYHAKPMGVVAGYGGVFEHASFMSHRWYCWPDSTEGSLLSPGVSLGEITLRRENETHELLLQPRCVDMNGHCGQWHSQGECERNPGFMLRGCMRTCGGCNGWNWLYELELGVLHEALDCLRPYNTHCALHDQTNLPTEHVKLSSHHDLRALSATTLDWLRTIVRHHPATLQNLERALGGLPPIAASSFTEAPSRKQEL